MIVSKTLHTVHFLTTRFLSTPCFFLALNFSVSSGRTQEQEQRQDEYVSPAPLLRERKTPILMDLFGGNIHDENDTNFRMLNLAWERFPLLASLQLPQNPHDKNHRNHEPTCAVDNKDSNDDHRTCTNTAKTDEDHDTQYSSNHDASNETYVKYRKIPTISILTKATPNDSHIELLHRRSKLISSLDLSMQNLDKLLLTFATSPQPHSIHSSKPPPNNQQYLETKLNHGTHFQLVKKILRPHPQNLTQVEEWSGIFPHDTIELYNVHRAVLQHGFSIIINGVESVWKSVGKFSKLLEKEMGVPHVSCNLYLTPPPPASDKAHLQKTQGSQPPSRISGFEVHFDWMDVLILQISGTKVWTVASTPEVYLPNPESKIKPTVSRVYEYAHGSHDVALEEEFAAFVSETNLEAESVKWQEQQAQPQHSVKNVYQEFRLYPGDVLYIPRGYLHNASTTLDSVSRAPENHNQQQQQQQEPSMHVTFGLEHGCTSTVEALLHDIIEVYYEQYNHGEGQSVKEAVVVHCQEGRIFPLYHNDDNGRESLAASPACKDKSCVEITWKDAMHLSLSEVARRRLSCPPHSIQKHYNTNPGTTQEDWEVQACRIMRQSVFVPGPGRPGVNQDVQLALKVWANLVSNEDKIWEFADTLHQAALENDADEDNETDAGKDREEKGRWLKYCHPYMSAIHELGSFASKVECMATYHKHITTAATGHLQQEQKGEDVTDRSILLRDSLAQKIEGVVRYTLNESHIDEMLKSAWRLYLRRIQDTQDKDPTRRGK